MQLPDGSGFEAATAAQAEAKTGKEAGKITDKTPSGFKFKFAFWVNMALQRLIKVIYFLSE